jgi:hypothetical protein
MYHSNRPFKFVLTGEALRVSMSREKFRIRNTEAGDVNLPFFPEWNTLPKRSLSAGRTECTFVFGDDKMLKNN